MTAVMLDVAPGLKARAATPADAAAIAAIYSEGIADRIATFETEPRTPEQIAAWFRPGALIVVAERVGKGSSPSPLRFPTAHDPVTPALPNIRSTLREPIAAAAPDERH
jgi:hypothetical protein